MDNFCYIIERYVAYEGSEILFATPDKEKAVDYWNELIIEIEYDAYTLSKYDGEDYEVLVEKEW